MDASIKNILDNFKQQNTLIKLIVINVVVFLLLTLAKVVGVLFELPVPSLLDYIALSSNPSIAVRHIWTLLTYMFVHYDFLHVLMNMLMLYWFGSIFLNYFTAKNMVALYILGGLAGALFYILTFNTVPYFVKQGDSYMIGASASVMAIIFAAAFYNKNLELNFFFVFRLKIIYIAWALFVFDIIALGNGSNLGGHIAHIGGAVLGYIYAVRFLKGKDITKGLNRMIDKIANLFKPKPKMRVTYKNEREADYEYNERKHNEAEEIDHILDKIKQSGYSSLNEKEKKRLFDASKK